MSDERNEGMQEFCVDFGWMVRQAQTQRLSVSEIARGAGVCRHTVQKMLHNPDKANPRLKTCQAVINSIETLVAELESARQE
jgi:DNA-binding phage protein